MSKTLFFTMFFIVFFPLLLSLRAEGQKEGPSTGPVSIELWSLLTDTRADLLDTQTKQFNEAQNEVHVTVIHQGGYTKTKDKIIAAAGAGQLPTLLMVDYLDIGFYAQQGIVASLDNFVPQKLQEEYFPALMEDLRIDGLLYALPYNRSTQGLYINTDLLTKAGIDELPTNWDEFRAQARKVKDLGTDYYYGYSFFHQWFFDAIAYSWGSTLTSEEGTIAFHDEAGVAMMRFFQEMAKEELLVRPPTLLGSFQERSGAFMEGKVATVLESSSWLSTMGELVDFDWKFSFLPAGRGGHAVTVGGGNIALSATADVSERKAAAIYLDYITGADISTELHIRTGYMPTRKDTLNRNDIKNFHSKNGDYLVSIRQLDHARPSPGYSKNIRGVWYRMTTGPIARILVNTEDPQTVLSEIAEEFQTELDTLITLGEYIR